MSAVDADIPRAVLRPVNWALCGLFLFAGVFLVWAIFAPLATTLRLTGSLVSETPSFDVQHPYGGQIAEVYIRQHMSVQQGDLLLRLDTGLEQQNLRALLETRSRIRAENDVITRLLAGEEMAREGAGIHLILKFDQARIQAEMTQETANNLIRQIEALRVVIGHQTDQLHQMQARADRLKSLVENALVTRTSGEMLIEQIQLVKSEIATQKVQLIALEDQQEKTATQADVIRLSARQELEALLERNLRQLEEFAPRIAQLQDVVRRSELRAPIDGLVTELYYEASGMYAGRGQTIISLAKPLERPVITFRIPPHQIDQLRVGMTGRLGVPGLSQREMPVVDVTVTAISPRAATDEQARPVFFEGEAEIDAAGVKALNQTVGEGFAISADMPVELMIEGRLTTFAQYLTDPLISAFQNGLQD